MPSETFGSTNGIAKRSVAPGTVGHFWSASLHTITAKKLLVGLGGLDHGLEKQVWVEVPVPMDTW